VLEQPREQLTLEQENQLVEYKLVYTGRKYAAGSWRIINKLKIFEEFQEYEDFGKKIQIFFWNFGKFLRNIAIVREYWNFGEFLKIFQKYE
jgi:hypothetical protein